MACLAHAMPERPRRPLIAGSSATLIVWCAEWRRHRRAEWITVVRESGLARKPHGLLHEVPQQERPQAREEGPMTCERSAGLSSSYHCQNPDHLDHPAAQRGGPGQPDDRSEHDERHRAAAHGCRVGGWRGEVGGH